MDPAAKEPGGWKPSGFGGPRSSPRGRSRDPARPRPRQEIRANASRPAPEPVRMARPSSARLGPRDPPHRPAPKEFARSRSSRRRLAACVNLLHGRRASIAGMGAVRACRARNRCLVIKTNASRKAREQLAALRRGRASLRRRRSSSSCRPECRRGAVPHLVAVRESGRKGELERESVPERVDRAGRPPTTAARLGRAGLVLGPVPVRAVPVGLPGLPLDELQRRVAAITTLDGHVVDHGEPCRSVPRPCLPAALFPLHGRPGRAGRSRRCT